MDPVQEIKNRLTITDVVRDYAQLHPASSGQMKMLCPFHDDHDPSMIINERKGLAWCFSCNSGGDIFSFVQKIENCTFPESVRILAEKAGVPMEEYKPPTKEEQDEKERIFEVLEQTTVFFEKQLEVNHRAQEELGKRKYPLEILKKFRVGFAPDSSDALQKFLLEKSFSRKEMLKSGVTVTEDKEGTRTRDKFINRIIFPIWNHRGRICAFGGRYIGVSEKAPKYLNSPETEVYKKSEILYGFHQAKEEIKKQQFVILVEGYFDVLACHLGGFQNVVAVSGTAFTQQHAQILKRSAKSLALCLDVDEAGQTAARKATAMAIAKDLPVHLITIPGGKDPDEAIRENKENFLKAIEERKPALEAFFERSLLHRNPNNLSDKKQIIAEILPLVEALPSAIDKDHYLSVLSEKSHIHKNALSEEMNKNERFSPKTPKRKAVLHARKIHSLEYLLGIIIAFPQAFEQIQKIFFLDLIPEIPEKKFYKSLGDHYNPQSSDWVDSALDTLSSEEKEQLKVFAVYAEDRIGAFNEDQRMIEIKSLIKKLNQDFLLKKTEEVGRMQREDPENPELALRANELIKLRLKMSN